MLSQYGYLQSFYVVIRKHLVSQINQKPPKGYWRLCLSYDSDNLNIVRYMTEAAIERCPNKIGVLPIASKSKGSAEMSSKVR